MSACQNEKVQEKNKCSYLRLYFFLLLCYNFGKEFWDMINNKNKVSINLLTDRDIEFFTASNGDVILAIHVPAAKRKQKPVFINNDMFHGTFRRNWEGDYHCDRSEVLAMLRDEPEETMDMKVLTDMQMSELDVETVHGYRNRHMAFRREHVWEKLTDTEYLERIGAAKLSKDDGQIDYNLIPVIGRAIFLISFFVYMASW